VRRPLVIVLLALALLAPESARADVFGSISLLSDSNGEQVVYAHNPVISENGAYVAFDGEFAGQTGVWRRAVGSGGVIEPVAVGAPGTPAGSAELPSISAEGRYVSFTTQAPLSPANDPLPSNPDVYVRDMDVPEQQPCAEERAIRPVTPCAFTLASAVSGSTEGLTYEYGSGAGRETEEETYGALAAGRSSLTADGRTVVFVTTASSNLDGPGTPPLEVVVRHLETGITETVSVEYDPATGAPVVGENGRDVPAASEFEGDTYGPVFSQGGPPPFSDQAPYHAAAEVPASISADGSTVAWMAQDVAEQTPTEPSERVPDRSSDLLWRRIGDGEGAVARRVSGGDSGPFLLNVEGEGLWHSEAGEYPVPRLSKDGEQVAFIADSELKARGEDFGLGTTQLPSDLYIAYMSEGVAPTIVPLTEFAGGVTTQISKDGPITDYAISPEGNQVAFTTKRIAFPLGTPAYVSQPQSVPGMLELFDVDLSNETLTRVSHGYENGPSEHPRLGLNTEEDPYEQPGDGALSPSFTATGNTLVFASTASNLVFGDGNTPPLGDSGLDGSDVFAVNRVIFENVASPQAISPPPAGPELVSPWSLGVTAQSLHDGEVRLYVELPGAGTLRAGASAQVLVRSLISSKPRKRGSHAKTRTRVSLLQREVAGAGHSGEPDSEGIVVLTLELDSAYRSLATSADGLSALAQLSFAAPGHATLREDIDVRFKAPAPAKKADASDRRRGTR
jgi:hypothetical protein